MDSTLLVTSSGRPAAEGTGQEHILSWHKPTPARNKYNASLWHEIQDRFWSIDWSDSLPPSNWNDVKGLVRDVAEVVVSPLLRRARKRQRFVADRKRHYFWSTWQAHVVYMSCGLALLTGQPQLCLAVAGWVVVGQILWVTTKWITYIRDDPGVDHFVEFCTLWLKRFLREGEKICKGKDAVSFVMAMSVAKSAPTTFTYARYIVRYNMRRANAQMLLDAVERFGQYEGKVAAIRTQLEDRVKSSGHRFIKTVHHAATASFRHSDSYDLSVPIEVDLEGILDDGPMMRHRSRVSQGPKSKQV